MKVLVIVFANTVVGVVLVAAVVHAVAVGAWWAPVTAGMLFFLTAAISFAALERP